MTEYLPVIISVKEFLQVEDCPPAWRGLDLYLIRDSQVVFYVGQSELAFERVWRHLRDGYKGRSTIGRFILRNWRTSMNFAIELSSSLSAAFSDVANSRDAAERYLIEKYAPCFNVSLNRQPTPLPEHYATPDGALLCSRNLKKLIREADLFIRAEKRKAWLAQASDREVV
jgi:hypothetical protein